ncbi:unnamed protein product [Vitrella brassicaformis CCMP3155]|uniref:Serine/threonine-protein phosphatase n=2 Tax=Vitrella brassicaformis TaxID=1169539 RepID=A0A0G4FZ53_VITBC|nr:unnamed protein product [Vitrella brassicaformis CCMP3155]|eukprot:CEM20884.1 unnamed protein product [Vitrella brassicaformis CCMP3155]
MSTVEDQNGEQPSARFGHTTTVVGGTRVILFGGATGDAGRYTITADAYALDLSSNTWQKIQPDGTAPAARAAHAAACVDQFQLVIYGGATGGGSLSSDELYLLDFRNDQSAWMLVPVLGNTPGRRYGHTMVFHKPLLIVFGGNNGQTAENDIWYLDVERAPFQWNKVQLAAGAKAPMPRVYHAAEVCQEGPANGMMVVFGGRTGDNKSLKDAWGLRQHRDGRWDWVEAPTKKGSSPEPRFQHSAVFFGPKLLIVGGRGDDVTKSLPTSVYDTETCEWKNLISINRFRHSSWHLSSLLFAYGGFNHKHPSAPTADLQVIDLTQQPELGVTRKSTPAAPTAGRAAALPETPPTIGRGLGPAQAPGTAPPGNLARSPTPPRLAGTAQAANRRKELVGQDIRIAHQVYVGVPKEFSALVRKISIDKLEDEGKKINKQASPLAIVHEHDGPGIHNRVIKELLKPGEDYESSVGDDSFILDAREVADLCDQTFDHIQKEPMMLRLRAPIKVYGDIHGQFPDLMRLFKAFKAPHDLNEDGDIDTLDYLFLGDYVDRGAYSLETMCLLFALKCRYPAQIHLIRGNHEDRTINQIYGFRDECRRRLGEDPDHHASCWSKFNKCFEWMSVGAIIEHRILCIHGGIGGAIHTLDDIGSMQRPLVVAQVPSTDQEQKVTDLLWSDPTDNDSIEGVTVNETRDPDGSGRIVKFGPDRVHEFLKSNDLSMIIRAHECVMDGFERFAGGKLITLFSATDYCGHHKNAGALLFIRRDLTVVPKIIYPTERSHAVWDSAITQARPPTPPRPLPRARREDFPS